MFSSPQLAQAPRVAGAKAQPWDNSAQSPALAESSPVISHESKGENPLCQRKGTQTGGMIQQARRACDGDTSIKQMCDSALRQWRKWLSHVRDRRTRGYMFQQKARSVCKKGNLHLNSGTNHNPARADERLVGSHEHTHSCEGCCGYTPGSNGRWGDAIPDHLACVWRPGRAPEPWKWRHSPL